MSGLLLPILLFAVALAATFLTYRNIRRGGARFYTLEREIILRRAAFTLIVAAVFYTANVGIAQPVAGIGYEMTLIAAVVIGGTLMTGGRFSLAGSVLGALLIQSVTTTIYALGVPPEVVMVVKSLVVLMVVLLFSQAKPGAPVQAAVNTEPLVRGSRPTGTRGPPVVPP